MTGLAGVAVGAGCELWAVGRELERPLVGAVVASPQPGLLSPQPTARSTPPDHPPTNPAHCRKRTFNRLRSDPMDSSRS